MNQRVSAVFSKSRAINEWIRNDAMAQMAEQLGLDELPMKVEGFNFYGFIAAVLHRMGFTNQSSQKPLEDALSNIFNILFLGSGKARGSIYTYPERFKDGKVYYFDDHFKSAVRQKAISEMTRTQRQKNVQLQPLYHNEEGEWQSGESMELKDTRHLSPEEAYDEKELKEKVRKMLADQTHGEKFVMVWDLMKESYNAREIAETLNRKGISSLSGAQWTVSGTSGVIDEIRERIERSLGDLISVSRKGFRFWHKRGR